LPLGPIKHLSHGHVYYYYVDGTTTKSTQDGTNSYPFKTMDQFFDACGSGKFSDRMECRCIIKSAGVYPINKHSVFASGTLHISVDRDNGLNKDNVILIFTRTPEIHSSYVKDDVSIVFYGIHYNFRDVTIINPFINKDNDNDGVAEDGGFRFESSSLSFDRCRILGARLSIVDSYLGMSDCETTSLNCQSTKGHITDVTFIDHIPDAIETQINNATSITGNNKVEYPNALASYIIRDTKTQKINF
jgi:hypothetical protein